MIESPFILLILNCKKYNYKRLRQKKDWLDSCLPDEFRYFHIQGDPSLNMPYVIDFSDNLITVQCDDGYMSFPKKMALAFKCINETYNYDYVLKTDDDLKLIKKDFFFTMQKYLQKNTIDYGGKTVIFKKPHRTWQHCTDTNQTSILLEKTTYCSGHFYFIKKNIIETVLARYFHEICKRIIEDHTFGCFISKITTNIQKLTIDIDKDIFQPYPIDGLFTGFYVSEKKMSLNAEYKLLDHIPSNTKNPYLYACQHVNKDISENVCIFESNFLRSFNKKNHTTFSEVYSKIKDSTIWDIICWTRQLDALICPDESNPFLSRWGLRKAEQNNNMPQNIIINSKYISNDLFQNIIKRFYDSKKKTILPKAWKLIQKKSNVYYCFLPPI